MTHIAPTPPSPKANPRHYRASEYFAGIGLARAGLQTAGISTIWSNDISSRKAVIYRHIFPETEEHTHVTADLATLTTEDLPHNTELAWASFPCQDLSVAGLRSGILLGTKSSAFWHFIHALDCLGTDRPKVVAIENVSGLATGRAQEDIRIAISALNESGYSVDILTLDARRFLPQSRNRVFLIGSTTTPDSTDTPNPLRPNLLSALFDDPTLKTHRQALPIPPENKATGLKSFLSPDAHAGSSWWSDEETHRFVSSLSAHQTSRLQEMTTSPTLSYRTAYRRMRNGIPRWEIRPDEISGCLRTSRGGSSKQAIVKAGKNTLAIRWMTPQEYANLMGLPNFATDAFIPHHIYSAFGDAVCVPVVSWLAHNSLLPLLELNYPRQKRP